MKSRSESAQPDEHIPTVAPEAPRVRKFVVILNQRAGGVAGGAAADPTPDAVRAAFTEAGTEASVEALPPEAVERALENALRARPDAIIVGGGDGTVRTAAALLARADSDIALGVLPLGTLNHFAKDLKMPPDWAEAARALATAATRAVDVGEINGHVFINNCSIGAYAETVRRRDALRERRSIGKWRAMALACWQTFRRLHRIDFVITQDAGTAKRVRTPLLVAANNRYSGHVLDRSLRARLDEGRLWLYTAHVHRRLSALRLAWQSIVRRLEEADALDAEPTRSLFIQCRDRHEVPLAADGEPLKLPGPWHVRIRPRALQVLVPKEAAETKEEK